MQETSGALPDVLFGIDWQVRGTPVSSRGVQGRAPGAAACLEELVVRVAPGGLGRLAPSIRARLGWLVATTVVPLALLVMSNIRSH